jgi:HEAT repeat protein
MVISKIIEEIKNTEKPLLSSHLIDLSQMTANDFGVFRKAWSEIVVQRRRQIITRLAELVKDNVELNFDLIYKHGLYDSDVQVRAGSIEGLWENENPSLIHTFIKMMNDDSSPAVQASAASALGRFSVLIECGEIRESYKAGLSQALLKTYHDTNRPVEVRRRALESVSALILPAVKDSIIKAYESRDERFITSAVFAMGKTCDTSWLPLLNKELANADAEIRFEAASAIGEIGSEASVPYLLEHINDDDVEVRMAVIQSLGKIGGTEAKKSLQRINRDTNLAVREAVEQALAEIETMKNMTMMEMDSPGELDDRRN